MVIPLLLLLAATANQPSISYPEIKQSLYQMAADMKALLAKQSEFEIRTMLLQHQPKLRAPVINKVLTILQCTQRNVLHNHILSITDYALPSSEKRLWIFDLKTKKLLFHTYVSHGIGSGHLVSQNFSNKFNSKATSIGVYRTEQTYYGRDGLSLRFSGLDSGFNNNAAGRYIVMHGGWYVNEDFIKKYGRAGRSWGCPAVPETLKANIINTIKENSLFVAYYPQDEWIAKSRFLHCSTALAKQDLNPDNVAKVPENDTREAVLLTYTHAHKSSEENEAVLAMRADNYQKIFHTTVPLERMLRRQIAHEEYVALSHEEFKNIATNQKEHLAAICFVAPMIKMIRGYYETQMHILDMGTITSVDHSSGDTFQVKTHKNQQYTLRSTNRFIRWLGL